MLCEYRDIAEVPLCFLPYFLACSILKVVPALETPDPVMRTRTAFPIIFVPWGLTMMEATQDFASHVIAVVVSMERSP